MSGHLFVLRGDLIALACDALLVPMDSERQIVVKHFGRLIRPERLGPVNSAGWAVVRPVANGGWWADVEEYDGKRVRLVDTVGPPPEVAGRVVAAITDLVQDRRTRPGRSRPLIALPLVGSGAGGYRHRRGAVINALLAGLASVEAEVDIALVLRRDSDYQAVQSRRAEEHWSTLPAQLRDRADKLGELAGKGKLSLFLGAGVSIPLGGPSWQELLEILRAKLPDGQEVPTGPDPVAEATALEKALSADVVRQTVASVLDLPGAAPGHVLLAGLQAAQVVTTNYDRAYETALDGAGRAGMYNVLARELPDQSRPWLLKLHGDVAQPETIVLTEQGYARLKNELGALVAVVEALLHTGHLLFVGYSLKDPTFLDAARRVADVRRLADPDLKANIATVLSLQLKSADAVPGIEVIPMTEGGDLTEAARILEIFLDRLAWAATRTRGWAAYLLDSAYDDLLTEDDRALARLLGAVAGSLPPTALGADEVRQLLARLGHRFPD